MTGNLYNNSMWRIYYPDLREFSNLSLKEERHLIARAKKGYKKEIDELVLRHIKFIAFRISKTAFPLYRERFGDDILSEAIFILYDKIKTYNLRYKDKQGNPKPVRFASYIWKRVDGFIIDFLKNVSIQEKKRVMMDLDKYREVIGK